MTLPPAGGPDMPPKTDPNDWTTPSGQTPVVINRAQWKCFEKAGYDMRWFVVVGLIPTEKTK